MKVDPALGTLGGAARADQRRRQGLGPCAIALWRSPMRRRSACWSPAPARSACSPRCSACSAGSTCMSTIATRPARSPRLVAALGATYHSGELDDAREARARHRDRMHRRAAPSSRRCCPHVAPDSVICLAGVGAVAPRRVRHRAVQPQHGAQQRHRVRQRERQPAPLRRWPPTRSRAPTAAGSSRLITRRVPLARFAEALRASQGRHQGRDRVRDGMIPNNQPHRGLRADRRLRERRARLPRRLDRLAVLAALRLRCLLRGAARHARARPLPHRAARTSRATVTRRYRPDTLILETRFETADGAVTLIDFMPIRGRNPDCVRIVVGERGTRARCAPSWCCASAMARSCRGCASSTTDAARDRRPRHGGAAHAGASARREHEDGRRLHGERGRSRAVRAELRAVASSGAGSIRRRCGAAATPRASGASGRARAAATARGGRGLRAR